MLLHRISCVGTYFIHFSHILIMSGSYIYQIRRGGTRRIDHEIHTYTHVFSISVREREIKLPWHRRRWLNLRALHILRSIYLHTGQQAFVLIYYAAITLAYFHSCINPIIYTFQSDNFMQYLRQAVHCCSCCNQQSRVDEPRRRGTGERAKNTGSREEDDAGGVLVPPVQQHEASMFDSSPMMCHRQINRQNENLPLQSFEQ